MPPVITAGLHWHRQPGAPHDNAPLDRRRLIQRFINGGFQLYFLAASPTAVRSHDEFAAGVVDAIDQSGAREAAEND